MSRHPNQDISFHLSTNHNIHTTHSLVIKSSTMHFPLASPILLPMTIQDKPIYNDDFITDINRSNNENGLEINEDLIESNWDKVTDR
jgi:hypothetical protein